MSGHMNERNNFAVRGHDSAQHVQSAEDSVGSSCYDVYVIASFKQIIKICTLPELSSEKSSDCALASC